MPEPRLHNSAKTYLRYSGIALQMGLTIAAFSLAGRWLDGRFDSRPAFTAALALLGVLLALYSVIRQISNNEPPSS